MNVFAHSGKLGDVIYSLPTVKALGGGKIITPYPELEPLLRLQPYVTETGTFPGHYDRWQDVPEGTTHNLSAMRAPEWGPWHELHLVHQHARPFGVTVSADPWLKPAWNWERARHNLCLVARSARYQRPDIDWELCLSKIDADLAFVGTRQERADFPVRLPWIETPTVLDLARVIYESKAFVGNQSFPLALAVGFGLPHMIEQAPGHTNCTLDRTMVLA